MNSEIKIQSKEETRRRRLEGVVVSGKMQKTVVVNVTRYKKHPKYLKYYKVSHRFKADNPENKYKVGDKVIIEETRPLSKEKRWRVIAKLEEAKRLRPPEEVSSDELME